MNHIETFKQKFFNIHYNNLEKLKTYNTSDNLEELNNIFEIITDFIIVYVNKLSLVCTLLSSLLVFPTHPYHL